MAIKRNKRFHVEVATSALSDIMFFLLLFFLIISTLANPNVIKMDLPKADKPDHSPQQHLTVAVTSDKKFYIDKEEVPFDQLEQKLIEKTNQKGDKTVVIRIPFDMQVQSLIDVLQIGITNDMKFVIATQATH